MYLLLALLLLLPSGFLQKDEEPQPEFELTVENVELVETDPYTFHITGVHECDIPFVVEVSYQENVAFIDITHEEMGPAESPMCDSEGFEFEVDVEIDIEEVEAVESEDFNWAVVVNNFAAGYLNVEDEAPAFVSLFRSPIIVEDIEVNPTEDGTEVHVRGQLPDGCEGLVYVRQLVDEEAQRIDVEIIRLLPTAVMCPMMLVVYDEIHELEGEFEGIQTVTVNDIGVLYDFDTKGQVTPEDMTKFYTVIETAEVLVMESFPPQLSLHVVGYQPDGCEFPVETEVNVDGDTITVEIFRYVPDNVRCPRMVVPYEDTIPLGSFESGSYKINVNETQVIEVEL